MKTSNLEKQELIDFKINIKIKLAALWTATTLCYLYGDYFELYTPGKVESLRSGENSLNSPLTLFIASLVLAIPPLMILMSLILKPNLNKILNMLFGSLFAVMMIFIAVDSLRSWYAFYVFLAILEAMFTLIIVWKAFTWPRQGAEKVKHI